MRKALSAAVPLLILTALTLSPGQARADADPTLGYAFLQGAIPWKAALTASRTSLTDGEWTTGKDIGPRDTLFSAEAVGFGAGIGYDGYNVQLDVLSLGDTGTGILTFGYRLNIQFGNIELWTRLGAGPHMLIDWGTKSAEKDSAAGITTVAEAGVDFFFWKETMAFGIKGTGAPSYTWPASFAVDLDLNIGFRLII